MGSEEQAEKPVAAGQWCGKGAWQRDASAGWNSGRFCTEAVNCGLGLWPEGRGTFINVISPYFAI